MASVPPQELEFELSHYGQLKYLKDYFNKVSERENRMKTILKTRRLNLSNNFARAMPHLLSMKILFPNLTELNLAENNLRTIEANDLVKCLPKLEILNISKNRLSDFEEIHALDKLAKLRSLDIRDNPSLSLS